MDRDDAAMTYDFLDEFAGPGGWDEGARMLGLTGIGIEYDLTACQTAMRAGHARICADVTTLPSTPFQGIPGYVARPPVKRGAWQATDLEKPTAPHATNSWTGSRLGTTPPTGANGPTHAHP